MSDHYEPHLAPRTAAGLSLCQCGCRECASLGLCVCLDCECDSQDDHASSAGPVEWITAGPVPLRGGPFTNPTDQRPIKRGRMYEHDMFHGPGDGCGDHQ